MIRKTSDEILQQFLFESACYLGLDVHDDNEHSDTDNLIPMRPGNLQVSEPQLIPQLTVSGS